MCRGAALGLDIAIGRLPFFAAAPGLAAAGFSTGASKRNWQSYGAEVDLPDGLPEWRRNLLCDPQTSGGLLIACAAESEARVLDLARRRGYDHACTIGTFTAGAPRIGVTE
jgi:selenide,water dikinase